MNKYIDKENKFVELFNNETGFYIRSGIIEDRKDTGVDPFMRNFPNLVDIGIMQTCVCAKQCNVDCYQKAIGKTGSNMSVENYTKIMKQIQGKVFSVALGGSGDVDTHENFEDILRITREHGIVPNFTTSGITMTKEKALICKNMTGAVAISEHFSNYTEKALDLLIDNGVKTSIHYVLSNKTIDDAIEKIKTDGFKKGINAVVFLLYKPVGLGKEENVLNPNDPRVKEFFELINIKRLHHKVGFDSCSCSGIINYTDQINLESMDYCEAARFSMYIDANMNAMPCSFANQNSDYFISLNDYTIEEIWKGDVFNKFRNSLSNSCSGCKHKGMCSPCPIVPQITLCSRKEKNYA